MRVLAIALLSFPLLLHAQDARLAAIHNLLAPLQHVGCERVDTFESRGATPAFTEIKHLLREWIESRVSSFHWNGMDWKPAPAVLQEQLNEELNAAGLFSEPDQSSNCVELADFGFLGPIEIEIRPESFLFVKTRVGVLICGYDESAYIYRRRGDAWERVWETEQDDYRDKKYFPQRLAQVLISATDFRRGADRDEHLILTLGIEPWCTSNWHEVYHRVWRTRSSVEPELLLDGNESAFIPDGVEGSVGREDVLFQYYVSSIEGGFTRPEIHHYVLKEAKLERADPIALQPATFVAWWVTQPWTEASTRTDRQNPSRMQQWLARRPKSLSEVSQTLHCAGQPDLWQVRAESYDDNATIYFIVRWSPPYQFTMMSIGDQPRPDCTENDPATGNVLPLFPPR